MTAPARVRRKVRAPLKQPGRPTLAYPKGLTYHCLEHGRLHPREVQLAGMLVLCRACDAPAIMRYKYTPTTPQIPRPRYSYALAKEGYGA